MKNNIDSKHYKFIKSSDLIDLLDNGNYINVLLKLGFDIKEINSYYRFYICKNILELTNLNFMGEYILNINDLKLIIKDCNSDVFCISTNVKKHLKDKWGNRKLGKYERLKLSIIVYGYLRITI